MLEGILAFITGGTLLVIIGILVAVIVFFMAMTRALKFIRKVPPNRALLVYGVRTRSRVVVLKRVEKPDFEEAERLDDYESRYETKEEEVTVNYRIVKGGMTVVLPVVHEVRELDLGLMTLDVAVHNVLSTNAVPITTDGIAQIKIGSDDTYIATAAEQLLDKDISQVEHVAKETLMGHLRAIIGMMTVEEVYKDREAFAKKVLEVAVDDLAGMGLEIISFTIKEISDDKGYLEALGRPEIAAKISNARQAEADADQNAVEREQEAEKEKARYAKDANIAKADFDAETDRKRAVAERAKVISLAEQNEILEKREALAAEQAAIRRDRQLDAEQRRPADAQLYSAEKEADGARAVGYADADVKQKTGEAEAAADKAKGFAEADVTSARGEAEGKAIEAKLLAEAKGRVKLVEALNRYGPNALKLILTQNFLGRLPEIAKHIVEPIAAIDEVRIVDLGGGGDGEGQLPFEKFADQGLRVLTKLLQASPALISDLIDDIVMAAIQQKAEAVGVEVEKEAPTGIAAEAEVAEVEETEVPAEVEAEVEVEAKAPPPPKAGARKTKKSPRKR